MNTALFKLSSFIACGSYGIIEMAAITIFPSYMKEPVKAILSGCMSDAEKNDILEEEKEKLLLSRTLLALDVWNQCCHCGSVRRYREPPSAWK